MNYLMCAITSPRSFLVLCDKLLNNSCKRYSAEFSRFERVNSFLCLTMTGTSRIFIPSNRIEVRGK